MDDQCMADTTQMKLPRNKLDNVEPFLYLNLFIYLHFDLE